VAVLSLLADPGAYRACEWELSDDPDGRDYWVGLFRTHIYTITKLIYQDEGNAIHDRVEAFMAEYQDGLKVFDTNPRAWGALTVLKLCLYRQKLLHKHGFPDPFRRVKAEETAEAIRLYPPYVESLNPLSPRDRLETVARGIFAGNEFDLGSTATTEKYHNGGHDFADTLRNLPPRPWPEDHFDAWADRMLAFRPPYRKALFFVDNAGADVILGCIPFARELTLHGIAVMLAANTEAALNDMTIEELDDALRMLRRNDRTLDEAMKSGRLTTVTSGCGEPLIDLARVSDACNEISRECDLLILEGMGRSVESNRSTKFTCDTLHIALIKDEFVAEHIHVPMFSPIFRFTPRA